MKDVVKKKINLSKKTKLWLAIIISLSIVITFFCGFFTYKLFLGEKKNSINWAVSMIDKYGCYYDENTGEIKKYSEEEYINMITSSLDKYSKYFSKESYNGEIQTSKGNFYGVGFSYSLNENKKPYILNVYWNSPAEKAGFNDNDKLISGTINGEKTVFDNEESFNTFLSRINDKEFSFEVERDGEIKNITSKKEVYRVNYVKYMDSEKTLTFTSNGGSALNSTVKNGGMEELDNETAYISIRLFEGNAEEGVKTAMSYLKERNKTKIILDLRDNGGGFMDVLEEVASYFVKSNYDNTLLVVAKDNKDREEKFYTPKDNFNEDIKKIVVLANENTASASECLIGAMLYYKTAFTKDSLIIEKHKKQTGEIVATTYGKGIMQTTYKNYTTGEAIKLTTAVVYQPDGITTIHNKGITTTNENSVNKGTALFRAIEILSD